MMRRAFLVLSILMLSLFVLLQPNENVVKKESEVGISEDGGAISQRVEKGVPVLAELLPHEPILITHKSNFSALGFSGEGTEEVPYIIEDVNITSIGTCLEIRNTDVHFIIQNSLFDAPHGFGLIVIYSGIYFHNVTNGMIVNCTVQGSPALYYENSTNCMATDIEFLTGDNPAYIEYSRNCTIQNSHFDVSRYSAIIIENSNKCAVSSCNFERATMDWGPAISVEESPFTDISNCYIEDWSMGIEIVDSPRSNVVDCTLIDMFVGIWLSSDSCLVTNISISESVHGMRSFGDNCTFESLMITGCTNNGIILSGTMCILKDSQIRDCEQEGVEIDTAFNLTFVNNEIIGNSFGIRVYVTPSGNHSILNNYIALNDVSGIHLVRSGYCHVEGNQVIDNGGYGLYISDATNSTISENYVWSNGYGMYISNCNSSVITSNSIGYNNFGIRLIGCTSNEIFGNKIAFSHEDNARDDESSNVWDNGVNFGNGWSDYDNPNRYLVDPDSGAMDRYPSPIGPLIESPGDVTFVLGSVEDTLVWIPSTNFTPDVFSIILDNEVVMSGEWSSGEPITYSIASLEEGTYNLVLWVWDDDGFNATDYVVITVSPPPNEFPVMFVLGTGICAVIVVIIIWKKRE